MKIKSAFIPAHFVGNYPGSVKRPVFPFRKTDLLVHLPEKVRAVGIETDSRKVPASLLSLHQGPEQRAARFGYGAPDGLLGESFRRVFHGADTAENHRVKVLPALPQKVGSLCVIVVEEVFRLVLRVVFFHDGMGFLVICMSWNYESDFHSVPPNNRTGGKNSGPEDFPLPEGRAGCAGSDLTILQKRGLKEQCPEKLAHRGK